MSEDFKTADWADEKARTVAHSYPLMDFGSAEALKAFATALREAHEAGWREGIDDAEARVFEMRQEGREPDFRDIEWDIRALLDARGESPAQEGEGGE